MSASPAQFFNYLAPRTTTFERAEQMGCFHPRLKRFTFSTGETILSCPDCSEFDASRRRLLKIKPDDQPSTEAAAKEATAAFEATLITGDVRNLKSLDAEDHGHDPRVMTYAGGTGYLADIAEKQKNTPEAHEKAVALNRANRRTPEEQRDEFNGRTKKRAEFKAKIRAWRKQ